MADDGDAAAAVAADWVPTADGGAATDAPTVSVVERTADAGYGASADAVAVDLLVSVFAFSMAIVLVLVVLTAYRAIKTRALLHNQEEAKEDPEAPSYTLVSGLPTYDEALDQLQRRRELRRSSSAQRAIEAALAAARAAGNLITVRRLQVLRQLSVGELIQYTFRSNSFDKS